MTIIISKFNYQFVLKQILQLEENEFDSDPVDVGDTLELIGWWYSYQGLVDKAEPYLLRALKISEDYLGVDDINTANILLRLSDLYSAKIGTPTSPQSNEVIDSLYKKSKSLALRALSIKEKNLGSESIELVEILDQLSILGESQETLEYIKRAY